MKKHQSFFTFMLTAAVGLSIGCSTAGNVSTNSSAAGNSSKPADQTKATAAGGETPKPANVSPATDKIEPVYTDISGKECKTTKKNESEEWMTEECPGVGGYKLEVFEGDLRSSVNVIAPGGKKSELDFQQVSGAFSTLGDKAEWRVEKKDGKDVPTALIVRFNASKGDDDKKQDSFLIVSKIAPEKSCITDVVKPVANANEEARKLAEKAADKPCKTDF